MESLSEVLTSFPFPNKKVLLAMAFNNKGADWLQNKTGTENPYFGKMMFSCGDQVEVIFEGIKK